MPKPISGMSSDEIFSQLFLPLSKGTCIGLATRWAMWPLEYAYYLKSKPENQLTYPQIFRHIKKRSTLVELNRSFFATGFLQTAGKSASNFGVAAYVETHYPNLSSYEQGMKIAWYSTIAETLVTSPGERKKVKRFFTPKESDKFDGFFSKQNIRVLSVSYIRLLWAGVLTYGTVYATTDKLRPYLPKDYQTGPLAKAIAGTVCGFGVQPLVMPFVNFQTKVLENPNLSVANVAQTFFNGGWRNAIAGTAMRSVCQGLRYGAGLGLVELFSTKKQQEEEPKKKLTK